MKEMIKKALVDGYKEILLEIFKRAGVNIAYEQDDYIEVEPETYGENVGFDFDSQGNFKKLL